MTSTDGEQQNEQKKKNTHRHTSEKPVAVVVFVAYGFCRPSSSRDPNLIIIGDDLAKTTATFGGIRLLSAKERKKECDSDQAGRIRRSRLPCVCVCVCVCRRRSDDRCRAAIDRALDEHRVEFRTSTTSASSAGLVKSDDVLRVLPGWLLSWWDEGPLESCEFYRDRYKINYKN